MKKTLPLPVESMKAGLAEREDRLRALTGLQDARLLDQAGKTAALDISRREVAKQTA